MFEKGKRQRHQSEEDRTFNQMLLWLAGAVVAELLLLLLQKAYVEMIWGGILAEGILKVFRILSVAGLVAALGCVGWGVAGSKGGKSILLPVIIGSVSICLWLVAVVSRVLFPNGVRTLMLFPAATAVLIIIFFLYQRPFFYNAMLTGGGMLALWLHGRYYMNHPRAIIACVAGGVVVLAVAAVLALQLKRNDGKLGKARIVPPNSNYIMTWITCCVTAAAMVLGLILGVSLSLYLLYVLVGWLFAQAVFFTVKMM